MQHAMSRVERLLRVFWPARRSRWLKRPVCMDAGRAEDASSSPCLDALELLWAMVRADQVDLKTRDGALALTVDHDGRHAAARGGAFPEPETWPVQPTFDESTRTLWLPCSRDDASPVALVRVSGVSSQALPDDVLALFAFVLSQAAPVAEECSLPGGDLRTAA